MRQFLTHVLHLRFFLVVLCFLVQVASTAAEHDASDCWLFGADV